MSELRDITGDGMGQPAVDAFSITPDDSSELTIIPRALLIGTAGDVAMTLPSGTTITLPLPAGYNPIRVVKVFSTGTTAASIYGLR